MVASKFTFEVPVDLRHLMDSHPEINWTAVFRDAIRRQAEAAEIARRIIEETSDPRVQAVAGLATRRAGDRFRAARGKRTER
ncbi:MAG: hypothetical protein ACYDDF_02750 [Thermoplasmatota archaeon]